MLSMDTARTIVGIIGNFTALVLFLSPLPTIVKIWKKKSVEQFSAAPYLATFLNCGMWMLYAIPSVHPNSFFLMTINGAGITIDIVFLLVFLFFSDTKKRIRVALIVLAEVVFIAALAIMVLTLAHTWKLRSTIVGSIVVVCSMLMYASPLAIMKLVITTKSVEYMPFSISLCFFMNGLCWTIYALIQIDPYILVAILPHCYTMDQGSYCIVNPDTNLLYLQLIHFVPTVNVPNGMGALSGLVQLVLYAIYYKSNKIVEEKQVDMEVAFTKIGLSSNEG